jgi:PAS domain S-box-containing protein
MVSRRCRAHRRSLAQRSVALVRRASRPGFCGTLMPMSLHVQPPENLATRLDFETLLVDLSARLVAASDDAFPSVVEDALGPVIRFFGADRGGILAVDPVDQSVHVIHGWYAEAHAERIPPELNVAPLFPYGYHLLTDLRQPFVVTSYNDVPPEAAVDRASHVAMGVRSTLNVPIAIGAATRYIMNMDALREEVAWPAAFVPRLQLLGEVFANTVERRRINEDLRTSEARFALATSFAGAGPWDLDTSTGRIWATPHAKALYGLPVTADLTFDTILSVIHPEDVDRVRGLVSKAMASGSEFADEYRIILPGGDIRWIAARGQFRPEKGAQPHHMLGISLDVTARKQAEAAQRAVVARLEASVESAGLGFHLTTLPGGTSELDDRARAILGVPPEQESRLRSFWLEHVHPDDRERVIQASRDVRDEGVERFSGVYRYQHPTRGLVWIQHTTRTFERDGSGRPSRFAGVLQDITEQKRAEEELSNLSRRLIQAQEAERALLARELHDDVTQRMAVLAIDLGRAESAGPGGVQAETLRTVREGLIRLSEDIHSLAYRLHPSVLEELGLAEALRTECERRGRRGGIDITLDLDTVPAALGKDAALCLYRVAQEALNNVVRHARARAASVVLRQMDGGLLLAVRDDGVGFDPDEPRGRGSLGLVSMRERLRLVNGTLDVESAPGHGTAVVAWVPGEGVTP